MNVFPVPVGKYAIVLVCVAKKQKCHYVSIDYAHQGKFEPTLSSDKVLIEPQMERTGRLR